MKEFSKNEGKAHGAVLVTGTNSGSGKTTLVIALLAALKKRGVPLSAFKCGPDYIDPMFHREVIGVPSYNLDPFFMTPELLREHFNSHRHGFSVIEGVMGYYDGVGAEGRFSTYDTARATGAPVLLVIDARGMSNSAAAVIRGFREYRADSGIKAVVFNNLSGGMYPLMRRIAEEAGAVPLGYLPKITEAGIESRNLGLITDFDKYEMERKIGLLGDAAEECVDIDLLLELAQSPLEHRAASAGGSTDASSSPTIAIARDRAFCFIYEENIEILRALGAKTVFFSPLCDKVLPSADGIYIPGGYPESHLDALSQNKSMLASVREAVKSGVPTIAECGGFMYLQDSIDGVPMVGAISGEAFRTGRLQRFGYTHISPKADGLLANAGADIRCHEFHYYDSTANGSDFFARKARGGGDCECAHHLQHLYAGFPHLYFPAHPEIAENFVGACRRRARL